MWSAKLKILAYNNTNDFFLSLYVEGVFEQDKMNTS